MTAIWIELAVSEAVSDKLIKPYWPMPALLDETTLMLPKLAVEDP